MILESKLVDRLKTQLDEEDRRAADSMAAGMIADWGQYQSLVGRRRAIADCKMLLEQTFEDLMKE